MAVRITSTMGLLFILTAAALLQPGEAGATQQSDSGALEGLGYGLGDPTAPIRVVEFVDMGCVECRTFSREVFPLISAEYVETGRAFWQVVPYVSGFQPNGEQGARAVECAAEQGAFWPMYDALFESQSDWWTRRRPQRQFGRYADALGLDGDRFGQCYRGKETVLRSDANTDAAAAAGVRATPTFFINGTMVQGALPAPVFQQAMEAAATRRR